MQAVNKGRLDVIYVDHYSKFSKFIFALSYEDTEDQENCQLLLSSWKHRRQLTEGLTSRALVIARMRKMVLRDQESTSTDRSCACRRFTLEPMRRRQRLQMKPS